MGNGIPIYLLRTPTITPETSLGCQRTADTDNKHCTTQKLITTRRWSNIDTRDAAV